MHFSSIPFLIAIISGFLGFLILRLRRLGLVNNAEHNGVIALIVVLLLWGGVSGFLADWGIYARKDFLAMAPGYWLPFIPVIITVILMSVFKPLRNGLRKLVDGSPGHWLTGIHMIRILATGSLVKASNGLFPEKFAWYVGIPDLIFGVSAVVITLWARKGRVSDRGLMAWHMLGAMVILVPANGFMHLYMQEALFEELFVFPMVLAPTLVVPTLVMLNLLVVWRSIEKNMSRNTRANSLAKPE
ncbi:hypothetical protein MNBD_GAMMA11-2540 [hydrothermal vent metagenome]|uniref:Uncharacterized protein n=1 Tax=hydrothermal vent metagenome TaxID=652676 RepID=A0A3B0X159_9ZZZZ